MKELLSEPVLLALLGLFSSLIRIWKDSRKKKSLKLLLRRERERSFELVNETWKTAIAAYSRGEPTTLADLLSKRNSDFRVTSSRTSSVDDEDEPTQP
jgi:hypothetical protein